MRKITDIRFVSIVLLAILLFSGVSRSLAQHVTARSVLDTSTILIGQQVTLKLKVSVPKNERISWPVFADSLAPGVEVVEVGKLDTLADAGQDRLQLSQQLKITSFDTGFHQIPAIPFYEYGKEDSLHLLAATNELFLTVKTIPVDTTRTIKDIKGIIELPLTFWEIFRWVLLGILIVFIIFGIWYYLRRRRMNKPVFALPVKPALPPHFQALDDLEKLRHAKLWQSGKIKEFHTQLTDILRVYLEKRFQVMALEMTSDEILESLGKERLPSQSLLLMKDILQLADLVKFAKEQPLPMQHDQSLNRAVEFVNLTILPKEEVILQPDTESADLPKTPAP